MSVPSSNHAGSISCTPWLLTTDARARITRCSFSPLAPRLSWQHLLLLLLARPLLFHLRLLLPRASAATTATAACLCSAGLGALSARPKFQRTSTAAPMLVSPRLSRWRCDVACRHNGRRGLRATEPGTHPEAQGCEIELGGRVLSLVADHGDHAHESEDADNRVYLGHDVPHLVR